VSANVKTNAIHSFLVQNVSLYENSAAQSIINTMPTEQTTAAYFIFNDLYFQDCLDIQVRKTYSSLMNKLIVIGLIVIGTIFAMTNISQSCQFNTDCAPGSQCLKASGALYGACVGGISPGNKHDNKPVYSPLDPNRTYGNTCSFDTDCGPGSACVKTTGIYGTCMRR